MPASLPGHGTVELEVTGRSRLDGDGRGRYRRQLDVDAQAVDVERVGEAVLVDHEQPQHLAASHRELRLDGAASRTCPGRPSAHVSDQE
jgi:hypothetical protein